MEEGTARADRLPRKVATHSIGSQAFGVLKPGPKYRVLKGASKGAFRSLGFRGSLLRFPKATIYIVECRVFPWPDVLL